MCLANGEFPIQSPNVFASINIAQSSVAQARLREQEAQQNFHIAVATIEGLVGNPFALARESAR